MVLFEADPPRQIVRTLCLIAAFLACLFPSPGAGARGDEADRPRGPVLRCELENAAITPITVRYLTRAIAEAEAEGAEVLGQADLDELLAERDAINRRLQGIMDQQTDPWGIKVSLVEVKHVDLPETMKRVMAKQAESERERRAKVIHAEGELQAASRLRSAAETIRDQPMAMQMRFLQTLTEVGAEQNTTIVFPVPLDLFSALLSGGGNGNAHGPRVPAEKVKEPVRT